jgi:hypothetical protein
MAIIKVLSGYKKEGEEGDKIIEGTMPERHCVYV